jgi:carboxypeptidase Taq
MNQARQEIPQLEEQIKTGDLLPLRVWLLEKIHSKGQRLFAEELIRDLTGSALSAKPFLDYLEEKYSEIYSLAAF